MTQILAFPDNEKLAWIRLSRTNRIGPVTFFRLLERFGTASKALENLSSLSLRGGGKTPLKPLPLSEAEAELAAVQKRGGSLITAAEDSYPLPLGAIDDPPPVLTVFGNLEHLQRNAIGIVGARNASFNGRKFAKNMARQLGERRKIVVSGLARGIDTAAHEGALETGTIAVVAGGVDVIYPKENTALYQQIIDHGGAIVAESPFGTQPQARHFPRRNRIISGLSSGVVVVEATLRSGSLITARMAGEQGRDVFAVPGFPLDPRAQGPNKLISDGAVLVQSVDDILQHTQDFRSHGLSERKQAPYEPLPLDTSISEPPEEVREMIMGTLTSSPTGVDELVRICQLTIPDTQTALLELELAGRVQRLAGNRVCLTG